MPNTNSRRLFIGVPPHPSTLPLLKDLQEQLRKHGGIRPSECRWTQEENIHLTLQFLGETDTEKMRLLIERMKTHQWRESHTVLLDDLVAFPQFSKARVAGIGKISETTELHALQKEVEAIVAACGFELERRDFTPHITLVRFTYAQNCNFLKLRIPAIEFFVEEVCLYESVLGPSGSEYTILERFKLPHSSSA